MECRTLGSQDPKIPRTNIGCQDPEIIGYQDLGNLSRHELKDNLKKLREDLFCNMISHPEVRTKSWDSTTQNISALKLKVNVGRQMINYNFNDCWHYCEINEKLVESQAEQ